METAKPYLANEQENYSSIENAVKAVVNKTFFELTGREIKEGGLIKQLEGLELNPFDLRQEIADKTAEKLRVPYLQRMPRTTKGLYDVFTQLVNAGVQPEEDYCFPDSS